MSKKLLKCLSQKKYVEACFADKVNQKYEYPLVPWISIDDQKPPERDILVWGKCDKPHIAFWDYNVHLHAESCNEKGHHFPGGDIEFTHWTELPIGPATWHGRCVATPTMKVE